MEYILYEGEGGQKDNLYTSIFDRVVCESTTVMTQKNFGRLNE